MAALPARPRVHAASPDPLVLPLLQAAGAGRDLWNGGREPPGAQCVREAVGEQRQGRLSTAGSPLLQALGAPALPGPSAMFLLLPFDSLVANLLGISLTVLFTLLLVFIIVPAVFGVSFGIRRLYMKTLLKIFQVSPAGQGAWAGKGRATGRSRSPSTWHAAEPSL